MLTNKDRWLHDRLVAAYWCGKMRALLTKPAAAELAPRQLSLPGIWTPPAYKR